MKLKSGATRIVEALQSAGVRCVFGLPGTQTVELFEALRQRGLRTVIATSELSAAFMAGGWARVTGSPGVLITISGPGFTWALTGIAEARLDGVPLVHIVGSPPVDKVSRLFRQQELAQADIARPLYKSIIDADVSSDLAVPIKEAMARAISGAPGPVLVQVTSMALQVQRSLPNIAPDSVSAKSPGQDEINAIVGRMRDARRPVFFVGQGALPSAEQLRRLIERVHAPIVTTPSARGVVSETHPLSLGFDPFGGSVSDLNEFFNTADVLLAIGSRLSHSDTSGFELRLPPDRLIHLDSSPDAIGANYPASLGVVGNTAELVDRLLAADLPRSEWSVNELRDWRARIGQRGRSVEPRINGTLAGDAEAFFGSLRQAMTHDAILVLDSGLHQILARAYFTACSPHGMMMPTDLQSMGFAIPTAIGAQLAAPRRRVVALVGDGGFAMTALELLSASRESIPLVVIVFVDGAFGQIRLHQLGNYGASHAVSLRNPDFELLATSVGAHYELVGENDEIESCVRNALKRQRVTVIEVGVRDSLPMRRAAATALVKKVAPRARWVRALLLLGRVLVRR